MAVLPDLLALTPSRCPVCEEKGLEWTLETLPVRAPWPRHRRTPMLVLACEECGETLALVEDVALLPGICAHIDGQHVATASDLRVDIVFST